MLTATALVAVVAVGCATMKMKPEEAITARQELMKSQGAAFKAIQDKTKAGDIAGVVPEAQKLVDTSDKISPLFPEGSLGPTITLPTGVTVKTAAKPEIWQKWPEFEAAAKNLKVQAEKLRDTAKTGDAAATNAVLGTFGRQACGTCHTPFRVPPPPQPAR
jgi:cytochrome c556